MERETLDAATPAIHSAAVVAARADYVPRLLVAEVAMSAQDSLDAFLQRGKEDFLARHKRKPRTDAPVLPKPRGSPERDAQRAVVAWLRKAGCIVQSSNTEQAAKGKSDAERARFGAARKASGATTGFPDLTVVTPSGAVAFIEMKAPKRGRLSDAQIAIHAELRARGCVVVVGTDIYSVQDALREQGVVLTAWRRATPVEPL